MTQNSIPDLDRYILGWHYTSNGHVWIDGITGGYVETDDKGRYYTDAQKAIRHRVEHIKQLMNH